MPVANVTVEPDMVTAAHQHSAALRAIVAKCMSTRRKKLTPEQVSLRIAPAQYALQISPVEIEVFGHAFLLRTRQMDKRAKKIADQSAAVLGADCSCWVNLCLVGYAPSELTALASSADSTRTA